MFAEYTGSCINHTPGLVTKQRRLVHLHQQIRALGDQTLILVRLLMFADYTDHTQDVVTKPRCLVQLHHTVLCNNYTQGLVTK